MSKQSAAEITIRKAKREDSKQIFKLVKELALFEKCPNKVKISQEQFEEDGFGETPAYACFVAESKGNIIGFALYFHRYSTWYGRTTFLEDLYVKPEYRGKGIGKELVKEVAKVAHSGGKRLDFHVLKWNPAKEFYRKLGAVNATETEEFEIFRFYEESLKKLVN